MTPSASIIAFIRGYEKAARLLPDGSCQSYLPTPNDKWTIWWGLTGSDIQEGTVWPQDQGEQRFEAKITEFSRDEMADLGDAPTTQGQYDAMLSLCFNIGPEQFLESTVLREHKAGDYAGAAAAFAMWDEQDGQVLQGLVVRRMAEASIYRGEP